MTLLDKLIALENAANDFGFSWENPKQIIEQIRSECHEIEVHVEDGDRAKLQEEIGDLLHAAFSLCAFCQFDPNQTLSESINKFERRLSAVKRLAAEEGITSL